LYGYIVVQRFSFYTGLRTEAGFLFKKSTSVYFVVALYAFTIPATIAIKNMPKCQHFDNQNIRRTKNNRTFKIDTRSVRF
jgi:hypothetical protein